MKRDLKLYACALLAISAGALWGSDLEKSFTNPPQEAKPQTWWHWVGSNISKDGIRKDIEAMSKAGLGGVQLFNASHTGLDVGPVYYGSEEWWSLLEYAADEAKKYNLEFTMANSAGWATTGGPHIPPEYAMQQLVWTETQMDSSKKTESLPVLEKFDKAVHKHVSLIPSVTMSQGVDLPQKDEWQRTHYKDIIVFAFPTPKDELNGGKGHKFKEWEIKSGNKGTTFAATTPRDFQEAPYPVDENSILDLTTRMSPSGQLNWTPPEGSGVWTVIRMGHIITGKPNHPAPEGGRGLEVDKLSREAVSYHFEKGILPFINRLNTFTKKRLACILIDSYEAKTQNWSPALPGGFKELRGYDMMKFMPAFTGRVVNNIDFTERFLWDFRRTIADMMVSNHFQLLADLCHKNGVKFAAEGYGHPSYLDNIEGSMTSDLPMAEFWVGGYANHLWTAKEASSIADLRNIPYVGAESFTSGEDFHSHPGSLKMQGDFMMSYGINRFIYHTYTHQPYRDDVWPGNTLYLWGSHFHRLNTWWNVSMPIWNSYVSRTQSMLQHGLLVADAAYYLGETVQVEPVYENPDMPKGAKEKKAFDPRKNPQIKDAVRLTDGYDFHFLARTFLGEMYFEDGKIRHKSGMSYHVIVVRDEDVMRIEILEKLEKLVSDGANIVAVRPKHTPGLENMPAAEDSLKALADKMWAAPLTSEGFRVYGKGRIYEPANAKNIGEIMQKLGVKKDFEYAAGDKQSEGIFLKYMHRKTADECFYFVTNQTRNKAVRAECVFRVDGYVPELWNAETGKTYISSTWMRTDDGRTKVVFDLDENGSVFVVFRKKADGGELHAKAMPANAELFNKDGALFAKTFKDGEFSVQTADSKTLAAKVANLPKAQEIKAGWILSFPKITRTYELDSLKSWTMLENFDDKHFSGTATYTNSVKITADMLAKSRGILLDLGKVEVAAQVFVNGKYAGTAWRAPYEIDITKFVREGDNDLKILVTNAAANRLIGDQEFENPYLSQKTVNERIERKPNSGGIPAIYEHYYDEKYTLIQPWLYDASLPRPETQRKAWILYNPYKKGKALFDSGLMGPVVMRPYEMAQLK